MFQPVILASIFTTRCSMDDGRLVSVSVVFRVGQLEAKLLSQHLE